MNDQQPGGGNDYGGTGGEGLPGGGSEECDGED